MKLSELSITLRSDALPDSMHLAPTSEFHKDTALDELAALGNVAQFVSFVPGQHDRLVQRHSRIVGFDANHVFVSPRHAIECLLRNSPDNSINLRSFEPARPQSRNFHYGIKSVTEATTLAERLAEQHLYVIANET